MELADTDVLETDEMDARAARGDGEESVEPDEVDKVEAGEARGGGERSPLNNDRDRFPEAVGEASDDDDDDDGDDEEEGSAGGDEEVEDVIVEAIGAGGRIGADVMAVVESLMAR
jgi:hypothetical protein